MEERSLTPARLQPPLHELFSGAEFLARQGEPQRPRALRDLGRGPAPFHATAALYVYRHAEDEAQAEDFLAYAYPKLGAWHGYLYRDRDPEGEGLAYIRHPWESGMDNSPVWDQIMQRLHLARDQVPRYQRADIQTVSAADRPTSGAYDRFAYLVEFFADRSYDEAKIRQDCPFLVQYVLFNSLLYKAESDLAEIARILGQDPSPHEERANKTRSAVEEKLWDEDRGTYLDYDLVAGEPIPVYFGASLAGPLYAGIVERDRAQRVVATLENDGFSLADEAITPIPSYDLHGYGFSEERYWRGPVWININWFLMHGLEAYGYQDLAKRLRTTIIDLCGDEGFHEYFDPVTGGGLGSNLFSWSAALLLDVLLEEGE
jgi:Trehalase